MARSTCRIPTRRGLRAHRRAGQSAVRPRQVRRRDRRRWTRWCACKTPRTRNRRIARAACTSWRAPISTPATTTSPKSRTSRRWRSTSRCTATSTRSSRTVSINLGAIQYERGKYPDAERYYRRASTSPRRGSGAITIRRPRTSRCWPACSIARPSGRSRRAKCSAQAHRHPRARLRAGASARRVHDQRARARSRSMPDGSTKPSSTSCASSPSIARSTATSTIRPASGSRISPARTWRRRSSRRPEKLFREALAIYAQDAARDAHQHRDRADQARPDAAAPAALHRSCRRIARRLRHPQTTDGSRRLVAQDRADRPHRSLRSAEAAAAGRQVQGRTGRLPKK